MFYNIEDKINFGKHNGFKISDIYQYEPTYIEWAIKYCQDFEIDPKQFTGITTPIVQEKIFSKTIGENEVKLKGIVSSESVIPYAKEYLKKGYSIPEVLFSFSNESLEILKLKKNKNYIAPTYHEDDWA